MYLLTNTEQCNAEHPNTFWIPSRRDREGMKEGDFAKLIFHGDDGQAERMWVKINQVQSDPIRYQGILHNNAVSSLLPKFGEAVQFGPEHVAAIKKGL